MPRDRIYRVIVLARGVGDIGSVAAFDSAKARCRALEKYGVEGTRLLARTLGEHRAIYEGEDFEVYLA